MTERDRSETTTIQINKTVRAKVKRAASRRAQKMQLSSLSMNDYLNMVADEE